MPSSPAKSGAAYTLQDLSSHNTSKDLWIAIHGKVYDVTSFVYDHPGGEEVLLEHASADATEVFEDVGHSSGARDLLRDFYIGELVASKPPAASNGATPVKSATPSTSAAPSAAAPSQDQRPLGTRLGFIPIVVTAGLLVAGVAYHWCTYPSSRK